MKISSSTDLSFEMQPPRIQHQALVIAKDFFSFVRHPTRRHPRRADVKTRAGAVFTLLALNALFNLLACVPVMLVLKRTIGLSFRHDLKTGVLLTSALALAPVAEELVFRAGLRSARWTLFAMPAMSAAFSPDSTVALSIAAVTVTLGLIDHLHRRRLPAEALDRLRWQRGRAFIANYGLIVHICAVSFAFAHFSNYVFDEGIGWRSAFLVLAVMSQLMSGLMLSYLRLRHGLASAMAAHFIWNAFAVGMAALGG